MGQQTSPIMPLSNQQSEYKSTILCVTLQTKSSKITKLLFLWDKKILINLMHLKTLRNYSGSRQQLPIPVGMQTQQLQQVKTTTLNSMKPLHCYNQKSETNVTAKILHKGQGTQMVKNNALFFRTAQNVQLVPMSGFFMGQWFNL